MKSTVLVTGGAGYIGSHTVFLLLQANYDVVVLDNLSNASKESLRRVEQLAGRKAEFIEGDVRDRKALDKLFEKWTFDAVIHFAGLKSVGESALQPLTYYENNVAGTITLCQAMQAAGVFKLVFSSSATVYGNRHSMPLHEELSTGRPTTPYGYSKLVVEEMLHDLTASDKRWSIALLRYFNPAGAHASGNIGEDPRGTPNNLLPYVSQVAIGRLPLLAIYGGDYPTHDGTGVRDYIHVMDLADGHLCALVAINQTNGIGKWNLGTGKGYSVLDVVTAFEKISGRKVPYEIKGRRPGDLGACWADATKAQQELGWVARYALDDMLRDTWRWQQQNPEGYGGS